MAAFVVRLGLEPIARDEAEALLAPVDANHDGKVTFEEWCDIIAPPSVADGEEGAGESLFSSAAAWRDAGGTSSRRRCASARRRVSRRRRTEPARELWADAQRARGGSEDPDADGGRPWPPMMRASLDLPSSYVNKEPRDFLPLRATMEE